MAEDDWKPHMGEERDFVSKSDDLLALMLGDNLQVAMLWLAGYAAAAGVVVATLLRYLLWRAA